MEVNGDGIRVLSAYLGRTASPMQAATHRNEGGEYRPERLLQPSDVAAVVTHALSLPPTAEVTDISIRPMLKPTQTSWTPDHPSRAAYEPEHLAQPEA
jgi:NADP-dependent 3-hydroxy acid dehydrogenase YdfG